MKSFDLFIEGRWVPAKSGETFDAVNPSLGEPFARVAQGSREDARRAMAAAEKAWKTWSRVPLWERADVCVRIAEVLESRKDLLADMLTTEVGKPRHSEAQDEAQITPWFYRQAAELARYHEEPAFLGRDPQKRLTCIRRPRGVVAVITPWNFPTMIPSEYLPYALVMGNTVVWTPAPTASACAATLMECFVEAGLPEGVINLVTGPGAEVGDEIVAHPGTQAIAMTGSSATGKVISTRAGLKPRLMELGGNGPVVVLPDADPVKAAQAIGPACFYGAGQVCSSAERIFVADNLKKKFVDAMVDHTRKWVHGDVWDAATTLGPQNNMGVVEKMTRHLKDATDKGAAVVTGGNRPDRPGFFFEPTVLMDFEVDSLVNTEETFGPIAPIRAFSNDEEAWRFINACPLGLVSAVFTENVHQAWKWADQLRTGIVVVNDQTNYWEPHVPFGGMAGNQSGVGRLGGRHTLEFMSELQTIAFHIDDR